MSYNGYPGQYRPPGAYNNQPPSYPPPSGYGPPPNQGQYPPQGYDQRGPSQGSGFPGAQAHGAQYAPPPGNTYQSPPGGPPPFMNQNSYGPPSGPPPNQGGYLQQQNYNNYNPPTGPPPPPPTQQQYYGPTMNGPGGEQQQPFFAYSQCTGNRKALCIGINYFNQSAELRGCINDARNIEKFLSEQYHYKLEDIVILTDDAQNPRQIPNKQNILQAMQWLVRDARPNDSLFFHYSGHGGQTKDLDGDEDDGFDEVIYPVDFQENGHIVDDEMHAIMVRLLPAGCRLTAIFDSCHSGSALDLPYIYSTEGKIKEPNLLAEAGSGLLTAVTSYARGDIGGVFKSVGGLLKTATGSNQQAEQYARATRTSSADVISWSGCKDSQTSADASEAGQATGAMSYAFIAAIRQNPQQSYQMLLNSIRDILRGKYDQKPQLSSSHPMDTNLLFIC